MGLKALSVKQDLGNSPCVKKNGGCSHLCFNKPRNGDYICDCPLDLEIGMDLKTCVQPNVFLVYAQYQTLKRVSLTTMFHVDLPIRNVMEAR